MVANSTQEAVNANILLVMMKKIYKWNKIKETEAKRGKRRKKKERERDRESREGGEGEMEKTNK